MATPKRPAKIIRPSAKGAARRERLFRLMEIDDHKPLLWISGLGGSGKTTLAASFLEARNLPSLWLRIDSGDDDPASFFHFLSIAAQSVYPAADALPQFRTGLQLDPIAFSRTFFSELFALLHAPCMLVFDNMHEMPGDSVTHRIITAGLTRRPEQINALIISREGPPKAYSRLKANDGMRVIDALDLRFTVEEAAEAAAAKGFPALPPNILEQVVERAGGWIAGMMPAIEHYSRRRFDVSKDVIDPSRDMFDYFSDQVFDRLDKATAEFLLVASILPDMTVDMVVSLSGFDRADQVLDDMSSRNLFVEKRQMKSPMYRFHPLFREYLLERAERAFDAAQWNDLKRRGGMLLVEEDDLDSGSALLIEAGDWETMTGLIMSQAPRLLQMGRIRLLAGWLAAAPEEAAGNPWLLYWRGVANSFENFEQGRQAFREAYAVFERQNDVTGMLLSLSGIVNAYTYEWRCTEMDEPLDAMLRLFEEKPSFPMPEMEFMVVKSAFFAMLFRRTEDQATLDLARQLETLIWDQTDPLMQAEAGTP